MNFFCYSCKINSTKILPTKIFTLTLLLKFNLSRFTSPVQIFFPWNIVLSSQCQIFIKKLSEIKVIKRMLKKLLTFHMTFKIFFQNYSLSIVNAHQSLAKRLESREWGIDEYSGFSHPLGRRGMCEDSRGGGIFSHIKSLSF